MRTPSTALALAALAALITLSGCSGPAGLGGFGSSVSGDVIDRHHESARTVKDVCYRSKTRRTGRTTTTRRIPYSCTHSYPDRWKIRVAGEDGRDRWVTVTRSVWRDCTPGDWYDATERDC